MRHGRARRCALLPVLRPRLGAPDPGETLDGKYEILDKIGEGGMGEVFRARHLHLDEIRIIKVTKPDPLGEGSEPRRFQEEARLATLVRHPNVAALYDFSRLPDGSYYMVWEFINGITLEAWLKKYGALPVDRALDVARQVLAGLAEIHAQGIVHRDLSPDNIMLRELPDGRLQAKIIDLGIAKRIAAESLKMTGTGMFVGKLKYCSPEQAGALGRGQVVDGRSDLYSFGVVLYEMLSGRAPFESQTPEGYLGMHLHQSPPPLETIRLPPQIAPALSAVVTKALEKSRDKRFPNALAFSDAIGAIAPAITESARQIDNTPTVPLEKAKRSARSAWIVAALAILAAVAAVWAISRREPAPGPASDPTPAVEPSPGPPTPRPTETIDEVVAAPPSPRVIENPGKDIGVPRAQATRPPAATPVPMPPPIAAAPPPPAQDSQPEPPAADSNNPARARQRLDRWLSRPVEERAQHAPEIARWANRVAAEHPNHPSVQQLKIDLPKLFKGEATSALDSHKPFLALQFYRAYSALDFAPPDPEFSRRMEAVAERTRRKN